MKKPLEGVPGLLLMAALIFFGATIGIGVALVFTWIPMSDALANFLGGVVGAGLGAALAVMGAVYVQRRDAQERLRAPLHRLAHRVEALTRQMRFTYMLIDVGEGYPEEEAEHWAADLGEHFDAVEKMLRELPDGEELSLDIHNAVVNCKSTIQAVVDAWRRGLALRPLKFPVSRTYVKLLKLAEDDLASLRKQLPAFVPPRGFEGL